MNPCLAWARSPTIVKLREGQRSSNICHSASVSSWASSTTMWANGPANRSESARATHPRRRGIADPALPQLGQHALVVVELEDLIDHPVQAFAFGGDRRLMAASTT